MTDLNTISAGHDPASRFRPFKRAAAMLCLAALAACSQTPPPARTPSLDVTAPLPRPDRETVDQAALRRDRAADARVTNMRSQAALSTPASSNMRDYLANVEQTLIGQQKMRTDDGRSITLTPEQLTENFIQIALYDEYARDGGRLISRQTSAPLRRWRSPVQLQLDFGDSVDHAQRTRDRNELAALTARLTRASGHSVKLTGSRGNFHVLFLSEDERRSVGPLLSALMPGIPANDIAAMQDLAPQNFCAVFAYSRSASHVYTDAVAVIRAELPPRLRRSCMHEEIAQGLGLANDSRSARPTIFNDDEEFAHLTWQDELLLKILYDPRLRPGMTEAEARPIVLKIARELMATEV